LNKESEESENLALGGLIIGIVAVLFSQSITGFKARIRKLS
jgi:hypothetical protein